MSKSQLQTVVTMSISTIHSRKFSARNEKKAFDLLLNSKLVDFKFYVTHLSINIYKIPYHSVMCAEHKRTKKHMKK